LMFTRMQRKLCALLTAVPALSSNRRAAQSTR
jgi:hypothetical protein